jgi:hypothetical protein
MKVERGLGVSLIQKIERDKGLRGGYSSVKKVRPRDFRATFVIATAQTFTAQGLFVFVPGFEPQRAHYCFVVCCSKTLVLYGRVVRVVRVSTRIFV